MLETDGWCVGPGPGDAPRRLASQQVGTARTFWYCHSISVYPALRSSDRVIPAEGATEPPFRFAVHALPSRPGMPDWLALSLGWMLHGGLAVLGSNAARTLAGCSLRLVRFCGHRAHRTTPEAPGGRGNTASTAHGHALWNEGSRSGPRLPNLVRGVLGPLWARRLSTTALAVRGTLGG